MEDGGKRTRKHAKVVVSHSLGPRESMRGHVSVAGICESPSKLWVACSSQAGRKVLSAACTLTTWLVVLPTVGLSGGKYVRDREAKPFYLSVRPEDVFISGMISLMHWMAFSALG